MKISIIKTLALGCIGLSGAYAGPLVLGANWVVNGDAESGSGSTDGSVVAVPGWAAAGGNPLFTAVQYLPANSFPGPGDPGPANRGANFFAGGPVTTLAAGVQTVDISAFATQIDQGALSFVLSAYLGGWQNQQDYADFSVIFLNASQNQIGGDQVVGPSAAGRNNLTGMLLESDSATIPVGTRFAEFVVQMHFEAGQYNDGYADNLSFIANAASAAPTGVPEPGSLGLMVVGALAVASCRVAIANRDVRQ
jgi:hypothetical protein